MHIKNRPQFDSGVYTHRLASFADVNGCAEEMVFETPFQNPIYSYRGPGRLAGQFLPFGEIPPVISLFAIGAPQGQPVRTQDFYIQESSQVGPDGVTYNLPDHEGV